MIAPILEEIAEEREDFKIAKIDVDQVQALAIEYQVMSIPTLMVFEGGEILQTAIGARSKEELLKMLGK